MVSYDQLEKNWVSFNHVYLVLYRPEQLPMLQSVLGADWNAEVNRQNALALAQSEVNADPQNAFAWFNIGTNLTYFDRYGEAVTAYDKARAIGLPQRMLRYQFGPFMAYFNTGRYPDLMSLSEYALKITPSSEEAMLWRGWGLYRTGDLQGAIDLFKKALEAHPGYSDAEYALKFVGG
jgi:tetratricopeptide (TPR) repeat protein